MKAERQYGFDFDGIIANTSRLKTEVAMQKFGVYVPIQDMSKEGGLKRGLTINQYHKLQNIVYSSCGLRPMMGAIKYLRQIIKEGHKIKIVS